MDSRSYWLGVATPFVVAAILSAAVSMWFRLLGWLDTLGFFFHLRWRERQMPNDYMLRHHIWWERSYGPIFVGGWYREEPPRYDAPDVARFNRWVGIGRMSGPNIVAGHSRALGEVSS